MLRQSISYGWKLYYRGLYSPVVDSKIISTPRLIRKLDTFFSTSSQNGEEENNIDFLKSYQKKFRSSHSPFLDLEESELNQKASEERKSLVREFYKYPVFIQETPGKCVGCGANLQTENPNTVGYVPSFKLSENHRFVCQRCYYMIHRTRVEDHLKIGSTEDSTNKDIIQSLKLFEQRLENICSKRCIIVYMVDIFDFDGSFVSKLPFIVGSNPVVLIVNKMDLLPEDMNIGRLYVWLKKQCEARGLTKIHRIHFVSCTKDYRMGEAKADIIRLAQYLHADVYVVGCTNVGKSTFINRLLSSTVEKKTGQELLNYLGLKEGHFSLTELKRAYKDKKEPKLTTSSFPGTTLNPIRIHFGRAHSLYDTPGIVQPHQITHLLTSEEIKMVLPKKRVRVVSFRLREGKCIHFGGLARIEMIQGKPFFFTVFMSNEVKVHPSTTEKAEELLETHVGGLLQPPTSWRRYKELGTFKAKEFELDGVGWTQSSHDIVISGLGWIAVTGCGKLKVRVVAPKGVGVFLREPIAPFEVLKGVSKYTGYKAFAGKRETRS
ncbi:hypothetical protein GpartN1_g2578.t1 [Galdieria partita]|uniref:G domain-containing protein n=1 Tax=Galdieria partita TaxID=83374 RepID=A0A9C7PVM8_9RHOD|nr:hypothetical protein GpartN1_g2578.t1 [Galdieria partita]